MGQEHLPTVDLDFVKLAEGEYRAIFQTGSAEEVDSARFRLIWALVHSTRRDHHARGLELCRAKLTVLEQQQKQQQQQKEQEKPDATNGPNLREFRYFAAGAHGEYPEFRQADFLRGLVDDAIVKEGLVGVGIGAAVVGVALAVFLGGRK
ncbi:hypothetical protein TSOC_001557 [Tetrabaena socialis]|uniref:Uncharacterized protein n=1 Tax=Tetrabaena socialis TaxID=47790 RepID=A0A2J8AGE9_9CHLO|nr:hypothetical protein TSOC_001557 [Tetrabaena socialis]|eukprot:PNH11589.1 hypothetical protein TSOC_001557 [Tetrabaena socialis]